MSHAVAKIQQIAMPQGKQRATDDGRPRLEKSLAGRSCRPANFAVSFVDRRRRLAGGRNILSASCFEHCFGALNLIRSFAMDGKKNSATLQTSLVALRFILRNSHANQCAGESANCAA